MDINLKRRSREKAIAAEVTQDCYATLSPVFDQAIGAGKLVAHQVMMAQGDQLADLFGRACKRHQLDEAAARRVWSYVPRALEQLGKARMKAAKTVARSVNRAADAAERAEKEFLKSWAG